MCTKIGPGWRYGLVLALGKGSYDKRLCFSPGVASRRQRRQGTRKVEVAVMVRASGGMAGGVWRGMYLRVTEGRVGVRKEGGSVVVVVVEDMADWKCCDLVGSVRCLCLWLLYGGEIERKCLVLSISLRYWAYL